MAIKRVASSAGGDNQASPYTELDRLAAWRHVLEELENKVNQGEQFVEAVNDAQDEQPEPPNMDFEPPPNLGPIPQDFELWARTIVKRQTTLASTMQSAIVNSKKHAEAANAARTKSQAAPIYLDTSM